MRKKLYKYKWVYWLILIVTILYSYSFNYATYTRIKNTSYLSRDIIYDFLVLIIGVLSLLTLFFLVKKNVWSIKTFNISNSLLLVSLISSVIKKIILKNRTLTSDDYIFFPIFTSIFCLFIFINNRFKIKENMDFDEIDEIGKSD